MSDTAEQQRIELPGGYWIAPSSSGYWHVSNPDGQRIFGNMTESTARAFAAAFAPQAPAGLDAIEKAVDALINTSECLGRASAAGDYGSWPDQMSKGQTNLFALIRAELAAARGGPRDVDETIDDIGCVKELRRIEWICAPDGSDMNFCPSCKAYRGYENPGQHRLGCSLAAAISPQPQPAPDQGVVVPEGWKLVPVYPTEEMIDSAKGVRDSIFTRDNTSKTWAAMLSAAPPVRPSSDGAKAP